MHIKKDREQNHSSQKPRMLSKEEQDALRKEMKGAAQGALKYWKNNPRIKRLREELEKGQLH